MKSILLILPLYIIVNISLSAQNILATYTEQYKLSKEILSVTDQPEAFDALSAFMNQYSLLHNDGNSLFVFDSLGNTEHMPGLTISKKVDLAYIKDFNGQFMIIYDKLSKDNVATRKDMTIKYDWNILDEYEMLGEHQVRKAELNDDNKKVVAYFREDILIPDGPLGYYGLPGLIVWLELPNLEFKLKSLRILSEEATEALDVTYPTEFRFFNSDEFKDYRRGKLMN